MTDLEIDLVEDGSISQAALHVFAAAFRLKVRPELTDDERASVDRAVEFLMAVSYAVENRVPLPSYDEDYEEQETQPDVLTP